MTRRVDTIPAVASSLIVAVVTLGSAVFTLGCTGGTGSAGFVSPPATYDIKTQDTAASDAGSSDAQGSQDTGGSSTNKDVGSNDSASTNNGSKDAGVAPKDSGASTGQPDTNGGSTGSCVGKCGAKYDAKLACQCNDLCGKYGNCCKDFFPACKPETLSCKNRCTVPFDKALPCQCGWDCPKHGSCCKDWVGSCAATTGDYIYAQPGECDKTSDWIGTKTIKDGDTLLLNNGETVRFLVVNTPEIKTKQCYAYDARNFTSKTLNNGSYKVCLVSDPNQPDKDKYNRLLRYVYVQKPGQLKAIQLNAHLVRQGYGAVFYPFAKGNKHEKASLVMQQKARDEKLGGWGKCGWEKELPKP